MMQFDNDFNNDYDIKLTRSVTIEAILKLDARFKREYLETLTLDALEDLEDSILNTMYETL